MKDKWRNYALKDGKVQSSYIREYSNRKKIRKTGEAGNCNSLQQSRQEQPKAEEEVKLVQSGPEYYRNDVNPMILNDAWVINLRKTNEERREENPSKTYQEGQQGVSSSAQGRCEAEKRDLKIQTGEEKMKKEKETMKHKKHEASESKAYEKKEDRKEVKKESKPKKK